MATKNDILKQLSQRKSRRWGIRKAADYVSSFVGCFGDGACPASLLSVPAKQWAKAMKEAESTLVYSTPSMRVKDTSTESVDGGILTFDCIITTTKKDRDGDVLESSGAILDANMPLLWQHLPLQPIGKFVKEAGRGKNYVSGTFAIADTELGRDAKTLVEFGALRISHGFDPLDFEPMYDEKDRHDGWLVKKFEILETSVVSIPANPGAVITSVSKAYAAELDGIRTAYGRSLLKTDAVKSWAKSFYDSRPVQGVGCSCQKKSKVAATEQVVNIKLDATELIEALEKHAKVAEPSTEKLYGEYYLPGSFESIQSQLQRSLKKHLLKSEMEVGEYCWCWVEATFQDYAIVCVEGDDHYKVAYTVTDGVAVWDGEPMEVEIEVSAAVMEESKQRSILIEKGCKPDKTEKMTCPECGHAGEYDDFCKACDEEKSRACIERRHFAGLLKDANRMREFRDRLSVVLQAQQSLGVASVSVLDDLLG